jgi:hypothetical protein
LPDEEDSVGVVERDYRDGAGMTRDLALRARAVGSLDRVDAEGQVVAFVDDPALDDPLGERVVSRICDRFDRFGARSLGGRPVWFALRLRQRPPAPWR